uniref:Protein Vpu n=1 Tax=Human immunodeficiency virus type 1 TaxID=11676 RepID=A0A140ECX4_HV1|nr:vpu protein [Human immunodeficiency virus 1]
MINLLARVDYRIGVGAFLVALFIAIIVWAIVYLEYRKVVRQEKINRLIKRIRERAEDSGNESDGDAAGIINNGVDMGTLGLLDGIDL